MNQLPYLNFEYIYQKIYDFSSFIYEFIVGFVRSFDKEAFLFWFMVLSFLISAFFVAGIVYSVGRLAKIRKDEVTEIIEAFSEKGSEERVLRWEKIKKYLDSDNSSDWRISVLEADSLLDEIFKKVGYKGETFGERLKQITPAQLKNINDVWYAHKVRNRIAHEGDKYDLKKDEAKKVIDIYKKSFEDLEYL